MSVDPPGGKQQTKVTGRSGQLALGAERRRRQQAGTGDDAAPADAAGVDTLDHVFPRGRRLSGRRAASLDRSRSNDQAAAGRGGWADLRA